MSITAKELAKRLGLSTAAVSMALNNKPGVSTETRRRVLDAAQQYGYDFTRIAQRSRAIGSIYFIIYKKHGTVVAETPFFSEVSEGISQECRAQNYNLKVNFYYEEDEETLRRQIEDLTCTDCVGILLLGTEMQEEDVRPFLKLQVPVVLVDACFLSLACDSVLINNRQGAYMATKYLIRKCRKQPGYLRSSYAISNFDERADGFYQALREHGMSVSKSVVHRLTPSIEGASADMTELLLQGEEPAPCYFADNDLIAVGAMRALKQAGYAIPADTAMIGFDNMPVASVVDPGLSTIHVPKQYMGQTAVRRLIDLVTRGKQPPVKIQIDTTLICRGTV